MRIALISYEFAGVASGGGIGTYVRNAATMMAERGHDVEVFTHASGIHGLDGGPIHIHGVDADRDEFADAIAPSFAERHTLEPFDVVEGPEFGADASTVAKTFPDLPLVVKLHTPTFLISEMNNAYVPKWRKARFILGGLRRGHLPRPYWSYSPESDLERDHVLAADEITAPSRSILELLATRWDLPRDRLAHIPYPFVPSQGLLAAEPGRTNVVTFLGRIEVRKGVVEFATAIREVAARRPDLTFRFIGRPTVHPATGEDMVAHLRTVLGECASRVDFPGAVPYADVPAALAATDICVFPSMWEASGFVCKEAMAAARGVIASGGSGMAEIIENGRTGLLVPPRNPKRLAEAIQHLANSPDRRIAMGLAARTEVVAAHAPAKIAELQEASYRRAIERKRAGHSALGQR